MQIFGLTKYGTQATTEHVNFRTYANTLVSLVRYSTGEGWNGVMHDFTIEEPHCVVAENYLDSDCGSLRWSYFLFLSFNVVSMYIFTAVFVAVVANNFSYVYQVAANFTGVNRDEIRKYPFLFIIYIYITNKKNIHISWNIYIIFNLFCFLLFYEYIRIRNTGLNLMKKELDLLHQKIICHSGE